MNKIKDTLIEYFKGDEKRIKIAVLIGVCGMALIFLSSSFTTTKNEVKKSEAVDYTEYTKSLENELEGLLSSIEGAGKCRVMITLEGGAESVYAEDSEIKTEEKSNSSKNEFVLIDGGDSEEALLVREKLPRVQGVTVVCSGGDNTYVKEKITEAVCALFNISANRVSVSKLR